VAAAPTTKARRRSSRSAKSPAISVVPTAAPPVEQPTVTQSAPDRQPLPAQADAADGSAAASGAEDGMGAKVAVATAPAARHRRKRPRVVSPAGPPRGAGQGEGSQK
jgi:ribonuclease E